MQQYVHTAFVAPKTHIDMNLVQVENTTFRNVRTHVFCQKGEKILLTLGYVAYTYVGYMLHIHTLGTQWIMATRTSYYIIFPIYVIAFLYIYIYKYMCMRILVLYVCVRPVWHIYIL